MTDEVLIRVEDLSVRFPVEDGHRTVVDAVSFEVHAGEVLGIVGESGSGKSLTALSLLNLVDDPGEIASGRVLLDGADVLRMRGTALQRVRGSEIGMIFQEPMRSLNPVLTIGRQLVETIRAHESVRPADAERRAVDWLRRVGLPDAERVMRSYPHEMSGGMLQRAMIAVALCCEPRLLIADEPTTALDVTIQAQILDLLLELRDETGMAMLFITHDLGVIAEVADAMLVMYGGRVVERGDVFSVFESPQHPYTEALLAARPIPGQRLDRLPTISDEVRRLAASGAEVRS